MSSIDFTIQGENTYLSGIEKCVLYPKNQDGVPWNGIISLEEESLDFSESTVYLDGVKHRNGQRSYNYSGRLEALSYPKELDDFKTFDLSYLVNFSNNLDIYTYELHLIYNATFTPDSVIFESVNNDSELTPFSWSISTKPVKVEGFKPTSHLVIKFNDLYSWLQPILETLVHGDDSFDPRMPSIEEVLSIFDQNAILRIIDNKDGTWTADTYEGYDHLITMLDTDLFQIDWSSALYLNPETYIISSY